MKRALALGALLVMGSVATAKSNDSGKTLISRDGHFAVRMPAAVVEQVVPSSEEGGTVWQYFYQSRVPFGNDYVVSCWDYTNAPRRQLDARELDDCVRVQREALRPSSYSVKRLRRGSVPGRELRIMHVDGRTDLFRFYVRGRRLYSISVCANGPESQPQGNDAFLSSFRLLP